MNILLVEDNEVDVLLTREALKKADLPHELRIAETGAKALDMLRRQSADLVLLDINLPGISGPDVLKTIKSDPELRRTPVVIFTSSDAERDVRVAYERHANSYIVKPPTLDGLVRALRGLHDYWSDIVQRP